jgi:hypothetical protein
VFNLEDLKGQNVIDWRIIIDFLVHGVKPEKRTTLTADELLHVVWRLQKDSNGTQLLHQDELPYFKPYFAAGLRKLKALIMNLPERPTIPLYCYTPIPELAAAVLTPGRTRLNWLFARPPPLSFDSDLDPSDSAVKDRLSDFLSALSQGMIKFFFDPPAKGVPSRGHLFGFLKELPAEAVGMFLFLDAQAEKNLTDYCDLINRRMALVLEMTE